VWGAFVLLISILIEEVSAAEGELSVLDSIRDAFQMEIPANNFGYFYGFAVALPLVLVAIGGLTFPTAFMMLFIYSWKFLLPGEI